MNTEEFTIYGIFSEYYAKGYIESDKFRVLMVDYLTLGPMFQVISEILKNEFDLQIRSDEKIKIDIQIIFKTMSTKYFYQHIPPFLNSRITESNIKIVKVALILYTHTPPLLNMTEIRNAVIIFSSKELENLTTGIPLTLNCVNGLLWKFDKCISNKVLEEWIKKCNIFLENKGQLQCHEFLYLICNCISRIKFFNRIPKIPMDISRNPKNNLFNVDSTGYKTLKNPDTKIQHYMNYQFAMDKAIFDGLSQNKNEDRNVNKRKMRLENNIQSDIKDINEFKKLLRDQDLYVEVKSKLKKAYQYLNHSKLNGKSIRFQIKQEMSKNKIQPNTQSEDKISKLKDLDLYKKQQLNRPNSSNYDLFTKEVKLHRETLKDETFAKNFYSSSPDTHNSPNLKGRQRKFRPQSVKFDINVKNTTKNQSIKRFVKSPISANDLLNEELSTFEERVLNDYSKNDRTLTLSKSHIYYGSSNIVNKKNYLISGIREICSAKR